MIENTDISTTFESSDYKSVAVNFNIFKSLFTQYDRQYVLTPIYQ